MSRQYTPNVKRKDAGTIVNPKQQFTPDELRYELNRKKAIAMSPILENRIQVTIGKTTFFCRDGESPEEAIIRIKKTYSLS